MTRFTSRFLVDLLLRETAAAGGFATVLAAGDAHAGTILVQCCDRGVPGPLLERRFSATGAYVWEAVGSVGEDDESRANYQKRRRKADPDLWIIELDIADAPRLVAEWGALT